MSKRNFWTKHLTVYFPLVIILPLINLQLRFSDSRIISKVGRVLEIYFLFVYGAVVLLLKICKKNKSSSKKSDYKLYSANLINITNKTRYSVNKNDLPSVWAGCADEVPCSSLVGTASCGEDWSGVVGTLRPVPETIKFVIKNPHSQADRHTVIV